MKEKYFQISGIVVTLVGLSAITFFYWTEPRTFSEVSTKGQVVLGTYEMNKAEFDKGLASFRANEFPAARAAFDRADPEKRNAVAQFYVAYSYYRQGWGRLTNDDDLFRSGLQAVNRVLELDPEFRIADNDLQMKTALELKTELEEGLKITASDFNPMRLTRERK